MVTVMLTGLYTVLFVKYLVSHIKAGYDSQPNWSICVPKDLIL